MDSGDVSGFIYVGPLPVQVFAYVKKATPVPDSPMIWNKAKNWKNNGTWYIVHRSECEGQKQQQHSIIKNNNKSSNEENVEEICYVDQNE